MSNLIINIRFGTRHLQITNEFPYEITFRVNPYHITNKPGKWFEIC